jgi:precorrin-2 C(20)-methyltransferase
MKTVGKFWAIGVGPGAADLLTLRAAEVLRRVHVVYHAGPQLDQGRAWEVVRGLLSPQQEVRLLLSGSMRAAGASDRDAAYRPGVERIAADCRQGRDVAFVTEGDPTLYSTAAHVWQMLQELAPEVPVEIVPAVSSITAAAARAAWPLAQKGELLVVVPAGYCRDHLGELDRLAGGAASVCLLKVQSVYADVLQAVAALRRRFPDLQTVYAENVGTEREWLTHNLEEAAGREEYFSLVLLRLPSDVSPTRKRGMQSFPRSDVRPTRKRGMQSFPRLRVGLTVVGIGPGDPDHLTCRAWDVLEGVDDIVGYEGYLQQLQPCGFRATFHPSPIGDETRRALQALELARQGRRVALVSSGDAGVYGMASLLLETAAPSPDVPIEIVPGVTAATAAAALLGAPLGHDFACISLSDLLTPWAVIERRLAAAAAADFVVVLYNPVSRRRTWQLPRAREILLRHRQPCTPVGLVDGAFRPHGRTWSTTLGELTAEGVTMQTTVIVGNSQTRRSNGRLVTPRGYGVPPHPPAPSPTEGRGGERQQDTPPATPVLLPPLPRVGEGGGGSEGPGRRILDESFALIERELGDHALPPWAFAVVRRMIHASGDFDFARLLRSSDDFESAVRAALLSRAPIVTDTEMVLAGVRSAVARCPGLTAACHLNDPEAAAPAGGLTRSAAGIRRAARLYPAPVLLIGNAPTALDEALALVEAGAWQPAAILGMPVGFVGVEEAKERLQRQRQVPWLTCLGRKGGSAVAAAALNALLEHTPSKEG